MRINIIGIGNVGSHLSRALQEAGHEVTEVRARSASSGEGAPDGSSKGVLSEADLCIISVKDAFLEETARRFIPLCPNALWVHTAGTMDIDVLSGKGASAIGVFYPMQTFSKEREVNFRDIAIFLECPDEACRAMLERLARSLTEKVYWLSSTQRRHLHVAAVFGCNFVNHCYALCEDVLKGIGLPFDVMLPLIDETARKVHQLSPRQAQTGPAVRGDDNVRTAQWQLLAGNPLRQTIYDLMSESIQRTHKEAGQETAH